MAAKLEPDLVVVAATMEAVLLALGVVGVRAKVFALVVLGCARHALARHTDEVIEHANNADVTSTLGSGRADESRVVALHHDGLELGAPELRHFQDAAPAFRHLNLMSVASAVARTNVEHRVG